VWREGQWRTPEAVEAKREAKRRGGAAYRDRRWQRDWDKEMAQFRLRQKWFPLVQRLRKLRQLAACPGATEAEREIATRKADALFDSIPWSSLGWPYDVPNSAFIAVYG
jgi:hypothetical protein